MEKKHVQRPFKSSEQEVVGYRPRVVVKFHDFVDLPYEDGIEDHIQRRQIGPWDQLVEDFPGIRVRRLCTTLEPEEILELMDRAAELDPSYNPPNLLTYFAIDCPPGVDPESLAKVLSSWRNVHTAYVESGPDLPPQVAYPPNDPAWKQQGYLDPAPSGIDVEYVWKSKIKGGGGEGIQFVDLERGWMLNHEDLKDAKITLIQPGANKDYKPHGTAVLGIVVAIDNNGKYCIGIAPNAKARVVSLWKDSANWDREDAILRAINSLSFGDVLLIELETETKIKGTNVSLPVETKSATFDYIRLGTALGIMIVEAAGNWTFDLDTFTDSSGLKVLNRGSKDFKDSGAIMVGAASSGIHARHQSNYGSRVDCYAWGINVYTLSSNPSGTKSGYTPSFSGTSAASAIIAGAGLVVQAVAEKNLGFRFSPLKLRAVLSDPATGTKSYQPDPKSPNWDGIGVMPNLKAIIQKMLKAKTPDVYIRDFVGDKGDPHKGAINASPDVILLPVPVANPQNTFGEGSKTENDNTLGHEAKAGQPNYIYVRVRNRGVVAVKNVDAEIYWSKVATLITPEKWTFVDKVTIPNVPGNDLLTVSDKITWPANKIPGQGHYCFVGLIGNEEDPAPMKTDFNDWDKFRRFIRENNNVTWRNFNVVGNPPPKPPSYAPEGVEGVPLPFIAPGTPEMARIFRLEVVAHLPEGARTWLETPLSFVTAMGERSPFLKLDEKRQVAWLPLNPYSRTTLGEALFPANSETELKLIVNIPEEFRENEYEVFVSQLYEDEEVGRVTWRLVPEERLRERLNYD